jgi:DNA-binding response OmpR family regulator
MTSRRDQACGNVLIVEDDPDCGAMLAHILSDAGYGVNWVQSRDAAVDALHGYLYDHIVLDVAMSGMPIDNFVRNYVMRKYNVVLISAVVDPSAEARRLGIEHSLRKPFDPSDLLDLLRGLSKTARQN